MPACVLRRLARMEAADRSARSNVGSRLERRVERLDDALRAREAALGDARDADALVRQLAALGRYTRAISKSAIVLAPTSTLPRAASTRLGRSRVRSAVSSTEIGSGSFHGVSSSGRRLGVYVSANPSPTSASSTRRRSCCSRVSRAEHLAPRRQRVRHVLEPEARDLLDHVDLARDVARAPGRHRRPALPSTSKPSLPSSAYCSVGRRLDADQLVGALGSVARPPAAPAGRPARRRGRPSSRAGELDDQLRREVGRLLRRGTGRRPSPSGSSPRCAAAGARRSGRSCTARSSRPRAGRSSSPRRSPSPRRP